MKNTTVIGKSPSNRKSIDVIEYFQKVFLFIVILLKNSEKLLFLRYIF